jgi:hypothetical protein
MSGTESVIEARALPSPMQPLKSTSSNSTSSSLSSFFSLSVVAAAGIAGAGREEDKGEERVGGGEEGEESGEAEAEDDAATLPLDLLCSSVKMSIISLRSGFSSTSFAAAMRANGGRRMGRCLVVVIFVPSCTCDREWSWKRHLQLLNRVERLTWLE